MGWSPRTWRVSVRGGRLGRVVEEDEVISEGDRDVGRGWQGRGEVRWAVRGGERMAGQGEDEEGEAQKGIEMEGKGGNDRDEVIR